MFGLVSSPFSVGTYSFSGALSAQGGMALHSFVYHLLPVDLRRSPSEVLSPLSSANPMSNTQLILSNNLPTLLLFECVLAYMEPASSSAVIQWFADYFNGRNKGESNSSTGPLGGIVYEMFGLSDPFGRVMLNNLKASSPSPAY